MRYELLDSELERIKMSDEFDSLEDCILHAALDQGFNKYDTHAVIFTVQAVPVATATRDDGWGLILNMGAS